MTLRNRLLKLAARRPLAALGLAIAAPVAVVALVAGLRHEAKVDASDDALGNPRAILGRVWFDALPEKSTDNVQLWIWLGGGIGLHETGSYFRFNLDLFDFERQGDKVLMTYLQDKKKVDTKFTIKPCDDKPPFDLCLDLANELGGRKRFYGFGANDDLEARVPWAKGVLRAAEARASR
jgi:hypothetical protein